MTSQDALREGKLLQAIEAVGAELRDDPGDARRRTFLFELLCFAGEYDRAGRQLDVLAAAGPEANMGTLLYRGALHAERTRHGMFRDRLPLGNVARPVSGTLNGRRFAELTDSDPRIGPRLEVFAAGRYLWLPLEHVASVRMAPPKRLRDLLWAPGEVRTGPSFRDAELGEVLLPVLAPLSADEPDELVRLGRVTEWRALDDGREAPVGMKMWLVDGEEFPFLELRELLIDPLPARPAELA
jgi:type VI secretion system protein ImpE